MPDCPQVGTEALRFTVPDPGFAVRGYSRPPANPKLVDVLVCPPHFRSLTHDRRMRLSLTPPLPDCLFCPHDWHEGRCAVGEAPNECMCGGSS